MTLKDAMGRVMAMDEGRAFAFSGVWLRAAEKHVGPTTRSLDLTDAGEWDDEDTVDTGNPLTKPRLSN